MTVSVSRSIYCRMLKQGVQAVLLLAVAAFAAGQSPTIAFTADVRTAPTPLSQVITKCFGSGHALLGLRSDWREQLAQVKVRVVLRVGTAQCVP